MSQPSETVVRRFRLSDPPSWLRTAGPGLLLVAGVAAVALAVGTHPVVREAGAGALTLAILAGMVLGNTALRRLPAAVVPGVDLARGTLLRLGIVLYGWRVTFGQIVDVGWSGVASAVVMLTLTLTLAVVLGERVLRLDRQTAVLIGAGSAICGAAAVLAVEPVVRAPAHKVSIAIATVVVFGTASMLIDPVLGRVLGMEAQTYGVFAGATIHEVAQVVVAGQALGPEAGATAVVVKMMRVMMLAPVLLVLPLLLGRRRAVAEGSSAGRAAPVPWFALAFIAVAGVHSLGVVPAPVVSALVGIDTVVLAMAMAALGLRTPLGAIRQAGVRPLALAAGLCLVLMGGGYLVTTALVGLAG